MCVRGDLSFAGRRVNLLSDSISPRFLIKDYLLVCLATSEIRAIISRPGPINFALRSGNTSWPLFSLQICYKPLRPLLFFFDILRYD
jgi:hypothetical protein